MKYFFWLLPVLCVFPSFAQMSDSFDDGDFTNNPTWTGDVNDFRIDTDNNNSLQLYIDPAAGGISYLSTPHNLTSIDDIEWRFKLKYNFDPSGSNMGHTYLTATDSNLGNNPDGIFFKIGETGSNDPIELIERNGGVNTTILTSTPALVASAFDIQIKIIHRAGGDWELYVDLSGNENFQLNQTANYPTSLVGNHVGICLYYTATRSQQFWYDDFYVGSEVLDTDPPYIDTLFPISSSEIDVYFNEGISQVSGESLANYFVNNGIGNPALITQDPNNESLFHLMFSTAFQVGTEYQVTINNVEDYAGNIMIEETKNFLFVEAETPAYGDVIINEFIPRPSPSQGLPESQFIELYNRSNKYFNLKDWKISDNNSSGYIADEVWLYPGEYIVLVPSSGMAVYPQATRVTSWATLNVSGDEIHVHSDDGILVDELTYTDVWYKDDNKKNGGWSIERINPELPCSSADNWQASVNSLGGTPGEINSVYNTIPDTTIPVVTTIETFLPNKIVVSFSEGMDDSSLLNIVFLSDNLTVTNLTTQGGPFPTKLEITFNENLIAGQPYYFTLEGFADCSGNIGSYNGSFIIPQTPIKGDLIINEILFNPITGGSDFVEVYNNSHKYIDIKDWELANFNDDTVANNKVVEQSYIIPPNDYLVLTKDTNFQIMNYPFAIPGKFVQMSSLPAYNNDSSTVFLIFNNEIMDKVSYNENWHFSLLNSKKGVSLERFSAESPSNDSSSWHSASETYGFATPGRENSQNMTSFNEGGTLSLSSTTFSPDNDGYQDVLIINYEVSSPDLLGDLVIYDDKGRKIKTLFEQHLLGVNGFIKWEGTRDDGSKAGIGPYIIIFNIFNLNSTKVETIRKVVTLAGKL